MNDDQTQLIEAIDEQLPQTQCRDCAYSDCRAYATAIVTQNEHINRCLPGGVEVFQALGNLLNRPNQEPPKWVEKTKPVQVAVIRESECIGCVKCIQACPVDAIIGAGKFLHTVLTDVCTGCGLCVPPCPVDCIDLTPSPKPLPTPASSRERYRQRQARLNRRSQQQELQHHEVKLNQSSHDETVKLAA